MGNSPQWIARTSPSPARRAGAKHAAWRDEHRLVGRLTWNTWNMLNKSTIKSIPRKMQGEHRKAMNIQSHDRVLQHCMLSFEQEWRDSVASGLIAAFSDLPDPNSPADEAGIPIQCRLDIPTSRVARIRWGQCVAMGAIFKNPGRVWNLCSWLGLVLLKHLKLSVDVGYNCQIALQDRGWWWEGKKNALFLLLHGQDGIRMAPVEFYCRYIGLHWWLHVCIDMLVRLFQVMMLALLLCSIAQNVMNPTKVKKPSPMSAERHILNTHAHLVVYSWACSEQL